MGHEGTWCVCVCVCAEMECDMPISDVTHRIILRVPFFEDIVFFVKPIQRCNCEDNPVCYLKPMVM